MSHFVIVTLIRNGTSSHQRREHMDGKRFGDVVYVMETNDEKIQN